MKFSEAIAANDADAVAKSVKRVKNINAQMRDRGYTPLSYAATKNADRVIPVLLAAGAMPQPDEVLHPLRQAASEGSDAAMAVLLDARKWEPKPILKAMDDAALQGKTEILRLLMDKADATPTPRALCKAAMTGRLESLKLLLERGGNPEAMCDGDSALHVAARAGYPDLVETMLRRGADVNLRDAKGRTPLMLATFQHIGQRYARVNYRERVRDLADPNSGVKILSGSLAEPPHARRTIETLLAAGADPTLKDHEGRTGLDMLAQDGRRIDKWLQERLQTAGALSVNRWPVDLVRAIHDKDLDRIRDLLSQGHDVNFTTTRHISPLTLACGIGNEAIVRRLLDAGADPNRPAAHTIPLNAAIVGGNVEVVRMLLDAGATPDASDPGQEGETPLRQAKRKRCREIAELLIERGAKLPEPKYKQVEPGVHWWNNWKLVVVKADAKTIARALDPTGDSIDLDPLGKTFISGGRGTFVVVQPKGLAWSNVLRISPVWNNMQDGFKQVAQELAKACNTRAIHAAYNDTACAAALVCYEADGSVSIDDGGADLESAEMVVSFAEEEGTEPPDWAVEMIRQADETGEEPPDSTQRLETLARAERFALGWAYFCVEPGEPFDVEFLDYPNDAFESIAFVDAPT